MAWTEADLKIFAAGLAIGGEWNGGAGSSKDTFFEKTMIRNRVMGIPDLYKGTSTDNVSVSLIRGRILDNIRELEE